jgi:hypothetical protein
LSVVHAALLRIFADNAVDYDSFLPKIELVNGTLIETTMNPPRSEPPILASELAGCLRRACWHKNERSNTNDESQKTLEKVVSVEFPFSTTYNEPRSRTTISSQTCRGHLASVEARMLRMLQ